MARFRSHKFEFWDVCKAKMSFLTVTVITFLVLKYLWTRIYDKDAVTFIKQLLRTGSVHLVDI